VWFFRWKGKDEGRTSGGERAALVGSTSLVRPTTSYQTVPLWIEMTRASTGRSASPTLLSCDTAHSDLVHQLSTWCSRSHCLGRTTKVAGRSADPRDTQDKGHLHPFIQRPISNGVDGGGVEFFQGSLLMHNEFHTNGATVTVRCSIGTDTVHDSLEAGDSITMSDLALSAVKVSLSYCNKPRNRHDYSAVPKTRAGATTEIQFWTDQGCSQCS
jgi:hypothetical protein